MTQPIYLDPDGDIPYLSIVSQPSSLTITTGQVATFTVEVDSFPYAPKYQWKRSNDGGATWANVSSGTGGTTGSFTTAATVAADNGAMFKAVISCGTLTRKTTNAAKLTLTPSTTPLSVVLPLEVLAQLSLPVTLTPTLTGGTSPYTFVWTKDGATLAGVTSNSFFIPSLGTVNQGTYQVTVRDSLGATDTATTKLFVTATADMVPGLNPVGVAALGNDVFLTSPGQNILLKLNRYSNTQQVISVAGGPTGVTLDDAGNPWVTLNTTGQVAKIDKTNLALTTYNVGAQPYGITKGLNNELWFTVQGTNQIGKISTSNGSITLYKLSEGALPAGLNVASDGAVWFTERGLGRLGRLKPGATMVEEWSCPVANARPEQILVTASGAVYYSDLNSSLIIFFPVPGPTVALAPMLLYPLVGEEVKELDKDSPPPELPQ